MKKILIALVTVALLGCSAFAEQYRLNHSGMTITIPDKYRVVTHQSDNDRILSENLLDLYAKKGDTLFLISDVFAEGNAGLDLESGTESEKKKYIREFFSEYSTDGYRMQKVGEIDVSGATFIKAYAYRDGALRDIVYFTVVHGYEFWLWGSTENEITAELEREFDTIVKSAGLDGTLQYQQSRRAAQSEIDFVKMIPNLILILLSIAAIILLVMWVKKLLLKRKERIHKKVPAVRCGACGARLSIKNVTCPSCGVPIARQRVCKKCGAPMSQSASFCTNCNTLQ